MRNACKALAGMAFGAVAFDPAFAQTPSTPYAIPCFSSPEVVHQLETAYGEKPIGIGIQSNGHLVQVFASEAGKTWTIVSTSPDGMACILAVGNSWENMPIVPNEQPVNFIPKAL